MADPSDILLMGMVWDEAWAFPNKSLKYNALTHR